MCNQLSSLKMSAVIVSYLVAQAIAYPVQGWNVYPQAPREYLDDDYYYAPKVQYYYDAPALTGPEAYGQVPYSYFYDPYGQFANEAPERQEERLAALPIGQETWFESETAPRWRSNDIDDVNAAFLDNLILTQMARDAQRRRENARAAFPPVEYGPQETEREDEDVRELKALAGKPMYHGPKTVPKIEDYDEEDYPNDEGFINWNGNKRSVTTAAPVSASQPPKTGQKEIAMLRPPKNHERNNKRSPNFYNNIAKLLAKESPETHYKKSMTSRRIEKRFVAGDSDLVMELRGLKHRIAT